MMKFFLFILIFSTMLRIFFCFIYIFFGALYCAFFLSIFLGVRYYIRVIIIFEWGRNSKKHRLNLGFTQT